MIRAEWLNSVGDRWLLLAGHAAWQAAMIGLVALVIVCACPRLPSPVRYCLLVLALVKFAMPPLLSLPTGVFGLMTVAENRVTSTISSESDTASVTAYVETDRRVAGDSRADVLRPARTQGGSRHAADAESNGSPGMLTILNDVAAGPSQSMPEPRIAAPRQMAGSPSSTGESPAAIDGNLLTGQLLVTKKLGAPAVILLFHVGGIVLCLSVLLVRAMRLHASTRKMKRNPEDLIHVLRECADHLGMRRVPTLLVTDGDAAPFSFGVLRPSIVISRECVERLSSDEMRTVLTHELTHHSRGDLVVNAIQLLIGVFWWFHPIAWILNRAIRRVREDCCDDILLSRELVQADPYCSTLLRVAHLHCRRFPRTLSVAVSMASPGHPLERRFRRIMDEGSLHADRLSRVSAIMLAAVALVVLPGLNRATDSKDTTPATSTTASDSAPANPTTQDQNDGDAGRADKVNGRPRAAAPAAADETGTGEEAPPPAWPRQLRIRVIDDLKQSIADASVTLRVDENESEHRTSGDGTVTLALPESRPERLSVVVDVTPFVKLGALWYPQRNPKKVPPAELTFPLARGIEIGGRIVDAYSQPIADAKILAHISSTAPRGRPRHTTTGFEATSGADGIWKLGRLPRQLSFVYLQVKHADYMSDAKHQGRSVKGDALRSLLAGEHVAILRKGHTVSGRVTDAAGQPVEGAKIWMGSEIWADHVDRPTTDVDGRYEFAHCRQGGTLLTVFKPGLAPELKRITIGDSDDAHDFHLTPGRTIRLRITDKSGQPLPGVRVTLDRWRGVRTLAFPKEHFDYELGQTDASGLWVWTWAPEDEIKYNFYKRGYMRVARKPYTPRDEPYVLAMLPELEISGSVVDDQSGEPIEAFRVTPGTTNRPGSGPRYWHRRETMNARNGRYSIRIDNSYEAHAIRIEADDYLPTYSRAIRSEEGNVTLDFRLKRSRQIRGVVLAPDGSPSEGAKVILGTIDDRPYIRGDTDTGRGFSTRTDQQGQFEFGAQNADYTVFIFEKSGFAHISKSRFEQSKDKPLDITVKPWARIEGSVARATGVLHDETTIELKFAGEMGGQSFFGKHCFFDYDVKADSAGRFVFDRVPPDTEVTIYQAVTIRTGRARAVGRGASASFKLAQGQTRKIKLGLDGRRVIGRVLVDADVEVDWESVFGSLTAVNAPTSGDITHEPPTHFRIRKDGAFRIDGVPPGFYKLFIRAEKPRTDPHEHGEVIGDLNRTITIPEATGEDASDESFDLGTLTIWAR